MKPLTQIILAAALLGTLGLGTLSALCKQPNPALSPTQANPQPSPSSENPLISEQPVAPEKNPPGDIPDTQVFVTYRSPSGGYQLKVPEGWARRTNGNNVSFIDKLDGVEITVTDETTAPTAATAKTKQVVELKKSGRAVTVVNVKDIQLPGGLAVLINYTSNSNPDSVTGKQIRLENSNYLFFKHGKLATLRLWAPQGADNVDQWQLISRSFRWL